MAGHRLARRPRGRRNYVRALTFPPRRLARRPRGRRNYVRALTFPPRPSAGPASAGPPRSRPPWPYRVHRSYAPGFTAQAFTGNLGGRPAAHARCDAAFAGSHMCHAVEYLRTVSSTPIPAAGAWIDASIDDRGIVALHGPPSSGRNAGRSCLAFTTAQAGNEGTYLRPNGAPRSTNLDTCATARPIACCD